MPGRHDHGAETPGPASPVMLSRYAAKRFATLQAEAALVGLELQALGGGYRVSRWNLTRDLSSIDEVRQMLAQIPQGGL